MGVDYSANFGIGVKLVRRDFEEGHEWEDDFLGYIDDKLKNSPYGYFEVGSEAYGDDINDFYCYIENPFEYGVEGLEEKCNGLIRFLNQNEIIFDGKIDIFGGLEIS